MGRPNVGLIRTGGQATWHAVQLCELSSPVSHHFARKPYPTFGNVRIWPIAPCLPSDCAYGETRCHPFAFARMGVIRRWSPIPRRNCRHVAQALSRMRDFGADCLCFHSLVERGPWRPPRLCEAVQPGRCQSRLSQEHIWEPRCSGPRVWIRSIEGRHLPRDR